MPINKGRYCLINEIFIVLKRDNATKCSWKIYDKRMNPTRSFLISSDGSTRCLSVSIRQWHDSDNYEKETVIKEKRWSVESA